LWRGFRLGVEHVPDATYGLESRWGIDGEGRVGVGVGMGEVGVEAGLGWGMR